MTDPEKSRFDQVLGDVMTPESAPLEELSPVARQSSIDAILAASAVPQDASDDSDDEHAWARVAFAAAAALLAVVGVAWSVVGDVATEREVVEREEDIARSVSPGMEPSVEPKPAGVRFDAQEPSRLLVGQVIEAREDGAVATVDSTRAALEDGASLRLKERSKERLMFSLDRGSARFVVDPEREQFVGIQTPDAFVSVVGTVFTVTVTEGNTHVEVERGKVAFAPHGMKGIYVERGQDADSSENLWVPLESYALEYDKKVAAEQKRAFEQVAKRVNEQPPSKEKGIDLFARESAPAREDKAKVVEDEVDVARHPGARDLLARARKARAEQDWEEAARLYNLLISIHPRDPAAKPSMVSLAKLSLEKLARPEKARYWSSRYLREAPDDAPLRRDARALHARSLEVLGVR
jgi:archaellum component FlaF (FlaF/FlaG flagellin family)